MKTELIISSLQQIVNFFKEETIDQIAKETGFSQRIRKLSPIVFLGIFTFGLIQKADATLVQLCGIAKRILPSLNISPQERQSGKWKGESEKNFPPSPFPFPLSKEVVVQKQAPKFN